MANIPTVKIKGSEGEPAVIIINAEDYDENIHTLATDSEEAAQDPSGEGEETLTVAGLVKDNTKDQLVALAAEKGIEIVPDEVNKTQIAEQIVAASGE